jgi:hypothetical protein
VVDRSSRRFGAYLRRSLRLLSRDSPFHFAAARRAAGGMAAVVHIDGEPPIAVQLERPPFVARGDVGAVRVDVSLATLDALLSAEIAIDDAIDDESLRLRGEADALSDCLDALHAWVHGAMRCPSLGHLHARYVARRSTGPTPSPPT